MNEPTERSIDINQQRTATLEALESTAATLDALRAEIAQNNIGTEDIVQSRIQEDTDWLEQVSVVAERISEASHAIFTEASGLVVTLVEESTAPAPPIDITEERVELGKDDTTLSSMEVELIKAMVGGRALRIEEIKVAVPVIKSLSTEDYDTFKKLFPKMQDRIETFLNDKGISTEWIRTSRNRGRRYQLDIEDSDQNYEHVPIPEGYLTDREEIMYEAILASAKPGTLFRSKDIDLSAAAIKTTGAKNQAFRNLTNKLIAIGVLRSDGEYGGRKYELLVRETAQEIVVDPEPIDDTSHDTAAVIPEDTSGTQTESLKYFDRIAAQRAQTIPSEESEVKLDPRQLHARLRRAARFTGRIITFLEEQFEQSDNGNGDIRLRTVYEQLTEIDGITKDDARNIIDGIVANGYFYKTKDNKAHTMLSKTPPLPKASVKPATSETPSHEVWTVKDSEISDIVISELAIMQQVGEGRTYKDLERSLDASNVEYLPEDLRKTVRRLTAAGVTIILPQSRNNPKLRVAFVSSDMRNIARDDRSSLPIPGLSE